MNESFYQRSLRVQQWLNENLSPWIEKYNINPGATVGGLCLYLATYTLSIIPSREGDENALKLLRNSFDIIRHKIQTSGITEPGPSRGVRGARH